MFEYDIQYLNDSNVWTTLKNWVRPIINKNTLDETHDETQIFVVCSPIDTPFKPFTRFIISIVEKDNSGNVIDSDTLYRVVIADKIKQQSFGAEKLYNHDITLAEASKELERYTVDNLSFTNEWNKAFQVRSGNAYIIGVDVGTGWYNKSVTIPNTAGNMDYYVNMFTGYNSFDAARLLVAPFTETTIPIGQTSIYKTLFNYNYSADFRFNRDVPTSVLQNNPLTIPSLSATSIGSYPLAYVVDQNLFYKWDATVEFRNAYGSITLIDPNGNTSAVLAGQQIQMSTLGRYRLRYVVTRQVRTHITYKSRLSESLVREDYFGWYDGLTTQLEFEIFCVSSGQQTDKLSIYDILNKLVSVTPTRFASDNNVRYRLYNDGTSKSIFDRYASVEAPEMILTNKNLWEALKEVGGAINAIPYLHVLDRNNWDIIDFLPLSSEEGVADAVEEEYSNSESYYDSDNYTASYDMSIDNMINPVSTKEGYIREGGFFISKTIRSEEVEISETSMDIETVYPIYKINSLKYVNYSFDVPQTELINNVQEEALYNALVSNDTDTGKAVNLYYTQGQKNIKGLQYKVSKNTYADALNTVAVRSIIKTLTGVTLTSTQLLQGKFIVEYVPYLNARIKIFKPNAPKLDIDTAMFQNQNANVVDARALGRKMVANIGRVGNLGYSDSINVYHLNNIPIKGQRSKDNYYVSTVYTEYDREHLLSTIHYTKDYQKISDWINISNLQRYYEVSEKQSVHRYINSNMFYIFGDKVAEIEKQNGLNNAVGYPSVNYLASLFVDQGYNRKINASVLTAYSENNNQEFICSKVYLNSNALAIGNNISIITDYQDNYGAGDQAVQYTDSGTQAFMNRAVPYSDSKGKIKRIVIQNVTDSNIVYPSSAPALETNINRLAMSLPAITALDSNVYPTGSDYITIADSYQNNNMPTFSNVGCKQDIVTLKDSREIIHFNQQHHFLVNDESVVIGNAMTEACRYIQDNTMTCRLVFLNNRIDAYEFKIKNSDIINITIPQDVTIQHFAQSLVSLGAQITNANLSSILSTTNHSDPLYIQPNVQYNGQVVGLDEPAYAWAIITNDNDLIIGKNQFINNTNLQGGEDTVAFKVNMSITSEF